MTENGIDGPDFFTDNALLADPYSYLAAMRGQCPVSAGRATAAW